MGMKVTLDKKKLTRIIRESPKKADAICGKLVGDIEATVKASFGSSPSAPGDPPGIDTGYLKNRTYSEKRADFSWAVVEATEYAALLEHGTLEMGARPHLRPAAEKVAKDMPKAFKAMVEV